jgi:hypothetical protein
MVRMREPFRPAKLKIERANKHILDINAVLLKFLNSDFYGVSIDRNPRQGTTHLSIDFDPLQFPSEETALIIGDALHNLRSALDLVYYDVVAPGTATKWTRFPIRDTAEELVAPLKGALEQKQISQTVNDLILDTIKPYKAGNMPLWALDDMNIRDKHQLLLPVLKLLKFDGIRLEDDNGVSINEKFYVGDKSMRIRLQEPGGDEYSPDIDRNVTVKDKGYAAAAIFFDLGVPLQGEPVVPSLNKISEEVSRTMEAFKLLLG